MDESEGCGSAGTATLIFLRCFSWILARIFPVGFRGGQRFVLLSSDQQAHSSLTCFPRSAACTQVSVCSRVGQPKIAIRSASVRKVRRDNAGQNVSFAPPSTGLAAPDVSAGTGLSALGSGSTWAFLRQRVSRAPICAGQGRLGRLTGGGAGGRATVLPELATIPPQSIPT
jgi:hypothetical protein